MILIIKELTVTEFKKKYKKVLNSISEPKILFVSGVSDFTHNTSIVQVLPEIKEGVLILTQRKKPIGYVIRSLDTFKYEEFKSLVRHVPDYPNYVAWVNDKYNHIFIFN